MLAMISHKARVYAREDKSWKPGKPPMKVTTHWVYGGLEDMLGRLTQSRPDSGGYA